MNQRPTRIELVWLPLVVAALLVIYLPALGNALVFDDGYLADGELFADYASAFQFRARMLSYGSFVWLQAIFGDGWWKQRVFNLLLHAGVVIALWALYRQILRRIAPTAAEPGAAPATSAELHQSPALGVAIGFFALNPVSVYAVAYLIQRSILMATLFVVLGFWLFARALTEKRPGLHALATVCYVLAVMSKEHAILAPLAAVPLYILVARPRPARVAMIAVAAVLLVGAAATLLALRYGEILGKPFDEYSRIYLAQLGQLNPHAPRQAFLLSIVNEAYLFFQYGLRWFLPVSDWMSVSLRPTFPLTWNTFPHVLGVLGYLSLVAAGFYLLFRHRDWRSLLGLSLLLPALLFMTEFATVWVQDPFVLYRSYLWAIGIPGLVFILVHGIPARYLLVGGIVAGAILVWQSLDRVLSLESPHKAWTDAIAKLPKDPRAVGRWFPYLNRGATYLEQNQFALALRDFEVSASLGDMGMGAFNMGSVLSAKGRHAEALQAFDRAEREGYRQYSLPFQRAQALLALERPVDAFRQLQLVASMDPKSPTRELMLLGMGRTAFQLGKRDEAIAYLEKLLEFDAANREGRFVLAMALNSKGDYGRARAIADSLVRERPDGSAHYARAIANHGLRDKGRAAADIGEALRASPNNANLRQWQDKIKAMP